MKPRDVAPTPPLTLRQACEMALAESVKGCAQCDERGRPVPGSALADAKISQELVRPLYEAARAALSRPGVQAARAQEGGEG